MVVGRSQVIPDREVLSEEFAIAMGRGKLVVQEGGGRKKEGCRGGRQGSGAGIQKDQRIKAVVARA